MRLCINVQKCMCPHPASAVFACSSVRTVGPAVLVFMNSLRRFNAGFSSLVVVGGDGGSVCGVCVCSKCGSLVVPDF